MLTYNQLLAILKSLNDPTIIVITKPKYFMITTPNNMYHITVFQDQWNEYEAISHQPYHLFHVSSNQEIDRCSSYFWVCKKSYKINNIPEKLFAYKQPEYSFFSSTRSPCKFDNIKILLKKFQIILFNVKKYH